jgi:hypothetical protein
MTLTQLMRLVMLVVVTVIALVYLHDIRAFVQTSAPLACLVK